MNQIEAFFKRNPDLNKTQKNIATSILLSGGAEEKVLETVQGYKSRKVEANSMTCPRCSSTMVSVTLADGRKVRYCAKDRVTLPFRVES